MIARGSLAERTTTRNLIKVGGDVVYSLWLCPTFTMAFSWLMAHGVYQFTAGSGSGSMFFESHSCLGGVSLLPGILSPNGQRRCLSSPKHKCSADKFGIELRS